MTLMSKTGAIAIDSKRNISIRNLAHRKTSMSQGCYRANYVVCILNILNQMGLIPSEQTLQDLSSFMDLTAKIQKKLDSLQTFYNKIENQALSGGCWIQYHHDGADYLGPNAYDGFKPAYYKQTLGHYTASSDKEQNAPNQKWYGSEQVSSEYQKDLSGFLHTFRELFQSGSMTKDQAVPVSSLRRFSIKRFNSKTGRNISISVDMTSAYSSLENGPFKAFADLGMKVFANPESDPNTSASLIQQYVFSKARVRADEIHTVDLLHIGIQDPSDPTKWLITDSTKMIDFDPNDAGSDGLLRALYNILNEFDTKVTVSRSTYAFSNYNNKTSPNLLQMISDRNGPDNSPDLYQGQWDALHDSGDLGYRYNQKLINGTYQTNHENQHVGLYGAFSYLAFNYFWSKNPSASIAQDIVEKPLDGNWPITFIGDPNYKKGSGIWVPYNCIPVLGVSGLPPDWNTCFASNDRGDYGSLQGKPTADKFTDMQETTQGSISLMSSSTNENSTSMQELMSQISQFQNIGQNMIKSNGKDESNAVKNNKI